jgi:hypothetical protein
VSRPGWVGYCHGRRMSVGEPELGVAELGVAGDDHPGSPFCDGYRSGGCGWRRSLAKPVSVSVALRPPRARGRVLSICSWRTRPCPDAGRPLKVNPSRFCRGSVPCWLNAAERALPCRTPKSPAAADPRPGRPPGRHPPQTARFAGHGAATPRSGQAADKDGRGVGGTRGTDLSPVLTLQSPLVSGRQG